MKTLKQIEDWAKEKLAPMILHKYKTKAFDHLGMNGAEDKWKFHYYDEVKIDNVLNIKGRNALIVNLIPRGAYAILTIHLYRDVKKIYHYCCAKKHHIMNETYEYYPAPTKEMVDAVLRGLQKSVLKIGIVKADDMWNRDSKNYDGGTVSINVNIGNKEMQKIIQEVK